MLRPEPGPIVVKAAPVRDVPMRRLAWVSYLVSLTGLLLVGGRDGLPLWEVATSVGLAVVLTPLAMLWVAFALAGAGRVSSWIEAAEEGT